MGMKENPVYRAIKDGEVCFSRRADRDIEATAREISSFASMKTEKRLRMPTWM